MRTCFVLSVLASSDSRRTTCFVLSVLASSDSRTTLLHRGLLLGRLLGGGAGGVGRGARAGVLRDELLGRLAGQVVRALRVRGLHEVRARAVELAAEAVVESQLAAAHGVDDDAGGVRRVPDLELELGGQR